MKSVDSRYVRPLKALPLTVTILSPGDRRNKMVRHTVMLISYPKQ